MLRRLLQAVFIIAFLCLLRSDEVLKIRRQHVEFLNAPKRVKLTLPFRKTHPGSGKVPSSSFKFPIFQHLKIGIKPFYLYALPEHEAHLCPVRALASYISASRIKSGYLFRRMAAGDRLRQDNTPMVRKVVIGLEHLTNPPADSRHLNISSKSSDRTSLMWGLTTGHTAHTPFAVEVVNIMHLKSDGPSIAFVSGEAGAPNFQT